MRSQNLCVPSVIMFQNYALHSYKENAIIHIHICIYIVTYCLNSRDYDSRNHLFSSVAFQSPAHVVHQRNPSISNLQSRAHANRLLSAASGPIIIEDRGRRSKVQMAQHLVIPSSPPFLSAFNIRDTF